MFGLVTTPDFFPDQEETRKLEPLFYRSIIYSLEEIPRLVSQGVPLLITLNNQCREVGSDWSGWRSAVKYISTFPSSQILGLCVGNEFDLYWAQDENDVPPEFATDLIHVARQALRSTGIKVIATSVAGPRWQEYLEQLASRCSADVDYFDFHGYGQRPDDWGEPGWGHGDLRTSLLRARELCGKPVIMSEYGVKIDDAGGETQVAEFMQAAHQTIRSLGPDVCPAVAWFAWTDQIGTNSEQDGQAFGLRRADGSRRPAWDTFTSLEERDIVPLPLGIDVSNHQGHIDWAQVAASDVKFAFIKATESTTFFDMYLGYNWRMSKANGLCRGAYHFARPDDNEPEAEADYFVGRILAQGLETGDMLVLDLEDGTGDLSEWTYRFLTTVKKQTGIAPLIYTSPSFIHEHELANEPRLGEFGLWLASWGSVFPQAVSPWSIVAFWQYTDSGSIGGVSTPVDCNRFNGPVESIPLYGKSADDHAEPGFTYILGFADLANELGRDIVGEPLENEHDAVVAGHVVRHQLSTRGEFTFWPEASRCEFRSFEPRM